jgi:hypothetical protein
MHASVHHVEVVDIVNAAVLIDNRTLRVVAHATGAGLVLAAAQPGSGRECPRGMRSRLF